MVQEKRDLNPCLPMKEEEILAKLKNSVEKGKYRDADEIISAMRMKYGLQDYERKMS